MTTERLQAAIAKARAKRDTTGRIADPSPADPDHVAASPSQAAQTSDAGRWNDLRAAEIDAETLIRNRVLSVGSNRDSTPFDILRTRILQRMRENGWRRIAITSPTPRCGKSTLALNLAFGMSRQPDRKIVSIETDMRRPSHETLLGIDPANRSVARFFDSRSSFADTAILALPNLAFATNSSTEAQASDVLLGSAVGPLLAQFDKDYAPDVTIFDTPPLLANDDAMAFLTHVDCALIIAAAGETTAKEIDQCERLIAQETQVMGVVLNKSRQGGSTAAYDYY
ncbi:CpsD/CapB family tyrosine-protein kinase [Palleronia sp. LCG004]|uniref:CpsD/CapB family tyrosine-protein kinase n=1 Tax=Palleronia sp. LCG004 TaxID=3079304 RepID=UPI0029423CA2|nr:CpsD/CapB family tyrosine-protein kinase [Palleronia sp. LCG004]WOI58422.1 CpsD/CapB family tyrosine-protein kinase [Palleronia sp. LCG004]